MSAPNTISGLTCWLDASNGSSLSLDPITKAVLSWNDTIGSRLFSGGHPQYAHYGQYAPGIQFRAGTYLQNAAFTQQLANPYSIICVVSQVTGGTLFGKGTAYDSSWVDGSAKWWFGDGTSSSENSVGLYPSIVGYAVGYTVSNQPMTNDLNVVCFNRTSTTFAQIYMNGIETAGYTSQAGTTRTDSGNNFMIGGVGRNSNNPSSFFKGTVHEVCVWNRVLTTTEITNAYTYFFQKWQNSVSSIPSSGAFSMSTIRNELGGTATNLSMTNLRSAGASASSNPNRIVNSGQISMSTFRKTGKYIHAPGKFFYRMKQIAGSRGGFSTNSTSIWLTPYENVDYPIYNYYLNVFNISQNTTEADVSGTLSIFQDDNASYYLNDLVTPFANTTYTGANNTYTKTMVAGKNIIKIGNLVNTGEPGYFQAQWYIPSIDYVSSTGAGLALRIPFDGSLTDVVGGAIITKNGSNDITYTTGQTGQAGVFASGISYTMPNPIDQPPFSISFWVKLTSIGVYGTMIGFADGRGSSSLHVDINTDGALRVYISLPNQWTINGTNLTSGVLTVGTWYHICVTVDSFFNAIIYKNGTQVGATQTGTGNFKINSHRLYIGTSADGSTRIFNGHLDELCLHFGCLQPTQVTSMYNLTPYYTNTSGNWYTDSVCSTDYYNWADAAIVLTTSGPFTPTISGSFPLKEYQLADSSFGIINNIYYNQRIQDYDSFVLYFEIYIVSGAQADSLIFFMGGTNAVAEFNADTALMIDFQIYPAYPLGIYLGPPSGSLAYYATTGFIASAWQPCYLYYTKGVTNTMNFYWNSTNVFNHSYAGHAAWLANSGPRWGFGARTGASVHDSAVRRVQLFLG